MFSIKLLARLYNFFKKIFIALYINIMADIKLGDLCLPKAEFSLKREILKTIKVNRVIDYIKSLKNNLKIKKE